MNRITALAVAAALVVASPASAHQANPNFLTVVNAVTPSTSGVKVDVINRDDQLLLVNDSGKEVLVYGYNDDPYARIAADGTVSVNTQSPAYYLNDDRYGGAKVPDGVKPTNPPQWKVIGHSRRFEWHDHRMHWMARTTPPQVKDKGKRTKVFDWKVPVAVAGRKGDIAGTLFWTPRPGTPLGFIIGASVLMIAACAAAIVVRRRRDGAATAPRETW